jgi:hypothetical protein
MGRMARWSAGQRDFIVCLRSAPSTTCGPVAHEPPPVSSDNVSCGYLRSSSCESQKDGLYDAQLTRNYLRNQLKLARIVPIRGERPGSCIVAELRTWC